MAAADGRRHWSSIDPAFLTWDPQRLVNWLRGIADAEPEVQDAYSAVEPNLQFEVREIGSFVRIRALFSQEFEPPSGEPWIDFTLGADSLRRFADTLEGALASFPIRVVEPGGPATIYQRQLALGVTRWRPSP